MGDVGGWMAPCVSGLSTWRSRRARLTRSAINNNWEKKHINAHLLGSPWNAAELSGVYQNVCGAAQLPGDALGNCERVLLGGSGGPSMTGRYFLTSSVWENTGTSTAVFIHHLLALDFWQFPREQNPRMIFLEGQFSLSLAALCVGWLGRIYAEGCAIHVPNNDACDVANCVVSPEVLLHNAGFCVSSQYFLVLCIPFLFHFSTSALQVFRGFSFGLNLDGWSENTSWNPSLCFSQNLNGLCRGPFCKHPAG